MTKQTGDVLADIDACVLRRRTLPMCRLLQALLDTEGETHAYELGRQLRQSSGSLSPMLAKLEAAGVVQSRWEDLDVRAAGRPMRKYIRLTPAGATWARAWLEER